MWVQLVLRSPVRFFSYEEINLIVRKNCLFYLCFFSLSYVSLVHRKLEERLIDLFIKVVEKEARCYLDRVRLWCIIVFFFQFYSTLNGNMTKFSYEQRIFRPKTL